MFWTFFIPFWCNKISSSNKSGFSWKAVLPYVPKLCHFGWKEVLPYLPKLCHFGWKEVLPYLPKLCHFGKSLIVYLLIIWGIQVLIIFLFKLATLHPPVKSLLQLLSCHAESVSKDLNSRPQPPQPEPFTLSPIYIKEIWLEAAGHMLGFNQLECFI